jgi:folate-dependent phosphoribosylglycinamide formyltransferase PurN
MRIGILVEEYLDEFNIKVLEEIVKDEGCEIVLAIKDQRPKKTMKQRLMRNIKKGRGGYIIIMAFNELISKREFTIKTEDFCQQNDIPLVSATDPYSSPLIDMIKKSHLDVLILVNGFGIIKEPLLSSTPLGILSYHHGDMRKYRGQPPAFWELYNGEKEMGVTVQTLSKGLDSGVPVVEKKLPIERGDNLRSLHKKVARESVPLMHDALSRVSNPNYVPERIEVYGRVYTLPNFRQYVIFRYRMMKRKISH